MFAAGLALAAAVSAPALLASQSLAAPALRTPLIKKPGKSTRVNVEADRFTWDDKAKIGTATGTVVVIWGPYKLTASKVVYDQRHNTFTAHGSVVMREPHGNTVMADEATMWNNFKEGFARHMKALLTNRASVTADYARRYENGIWVYERASYTACDTCVSKDGTPVWQIEAKQARHDTNKKTIYYKDMVFRIGGVPVAYTPYFAYPDPSVKRRTGFLWPRLKYAKEYGPGVVTPFFWALAPNYDLTFSPMVSKQGVLGDVEWRHRLRSGQYNVRAWGVHERRPDLTPRVSEDDRGAVRSIGKFAIDRAWTWGWDGTLASDPYFLADYDIDSRSIAANKLWLTGLSGRNYVSAQAINFMALGSLQQDRLPNALPLVEGEYTFDRPVLGGELSLATTSYVLDRNEAIAGLGLGTRQARSVTTARWSRQMIGSLGTVITPFANLRSELTYAENVPGSPEPESFEARLLPSAGFDARWPLVGELAGGTSVISPVVQFIAAPDAPDTSIYGNENAPGFNLDHTNLFLDNRASGTDRYEGGTRVNAGLTYGWYGSDGWSARGAIGESFQIAGDNGFTAGSGVDGPVSDIVAALLVQTGSNVAFRYEARAEEDLSRLNSQEATLGLTFDRISGSVSYADIAAAPDYGRPHHEQQLWGDASLALGGAWSLFGGLRYDLQTSDFVSKSLGLSYDCDCMTAKLTYSERKTSSAATPVDRSIKFTLSFRTLGKLGGGFSF
jgi:LPS-assembly protein